MRATTKAVIAGWMLFFCCVTLQATAQSPTLQTLEYAFDTDPGLGNGLLVTLPSAEMLDSTFSLDVSNLSTGLHTLFSRVRDDAGNWSMTQTGSFIKLPGNDTALSITQVEYFVDTDPGLGNGTQLSFMPGAEVTGIFDLTIPDNGSEKRTVCVRAKDNRGFWSLLSVTEVDMCELYKAVPKFGVVHLGNQFTFIDSSLSAAGHYQWKYFHNNTLIGTSTITNPQVDLPAGLNRVRLIAGTGCRKDSTDVPLTVNRIEDYRPRVSAAGGNVIINLFGAGLDDNATMTLQPVNGGAPVAAYSKRMTGKYQLNAMFDFHTVTHAGDYHLIVQFSNGVKDTVPYTLLPADTTVQPRFHVMQFGSSVLRAGVAGDYTVLVTNMSNMLVRGVPVWIAVPEYVNLYLTKPFVAPPIPGFAENVPTYVLVDSFRNKTDPARVYGIIVPNINPASTIAIRLKLLHHNVNNPQIIMTTWTHKPLFGSPLKYAVGNCLDGIVMTGLGFTPLGCISAGFDFVYNVTEQLVHGEKNYSGWGSYVWAIASTAISCIPGGSLALAYGKAEETVQLYNDMGKIADASVNGHNGSKSFLKDCLGLDNNDPNDDWILTINSKDPNAIYGPAGYEAVKWTPNKGKAGYMVSFENITTATANAQQVFIYDTLNKQHFDLSTFELGDFTIGDSVYTVPSYRQEYAQIVSVKSQPDVQVLYTAKLDTASGIVRHGFYSLDPVTKNLVDSNSIVGFLPPNTTAPEGEGSISYYIHYKQGLPTGTVVSRRAGIVFDRNEEILTNTWVNTIDTTRPASAITSVTRTNDTTAKLVFTGTDMGAGVREYELYISENGRPFRYFGKTDNSTISLTGSLDSTYAFYSKAIDQVNNVEEKAAVAEGSITFTGPLPVTLLPLKGQRQGNANLLRWATVTETTNRGFVVERSSDGYTYQALQFIATKALLGNSNARLDYSFTDQAPLPKAYYRLQQVDRDGKKRYSNVIRLDRAASINLSVYPNPATNDVFVLSDKPVTRVQLIDMAGRLVKAFAVDPSGKYKLEGVLQGFYLLQVYHAEGMETIKLAVKGGR